MEYNISLIKKHDHLVCIDSDGTVMDTMELKHRYALGPAFIDIFNLNENRKEILDKWVKINCFSEIRGYNRFITLKYMLKYLENIGYKIEDVNYYYSWVDNSDSLSIDSLEKEIKNVSHNKCLERVVKWAKECNRRIALLKEPDHFKNAIRVIKNISDDVDLIGISTANNKALVKEWKSVGIIDYFKLVASQEYGTKENVIKEMIKLGYDPRKIIMIGDSKGDLLAAKKNNVLFYPIIPNQEDNSWELFYNNYYPLFLNNQYTEVIEDKLIKNFEDSLKQSSPNNL